LLGSRQYSKSKKNFFWSSYNVPAGDKVSKRWRTSDAVVKPITSRKPSSCLCGSKLAIVDPGLPQGVVPAAYLQQAKFRCRAGIIRCKKTTEEYSVVHKRHSLDQKRQTRHIITMVDLQFFIRTGLNQRRVYKTLQHVLLQESHK